jgi:spore coat protein JB
MHQPLPQEYYIMLENLQVTDFVLVELTLYLDTHPQDLDAIKQFNAFSLKRKTLKEKFEAMFHPLEQYGHSYVSYPYSWSESPWPWQI